MDIYMTSNPSTCHLWIYIKFLEHGVHRLSHLPVEHFCRFNVHWVYAYLLTLWQHPEGIWCLWGHCNLHFPNCTWSWAVFVCLEPFLSSLWSPYWWSLLMLWCLWVLFLLVGGDSWRVRNPYTRCRVQITFADFSVLLWYLALLISHF